MVKRWESKEGSQWVFLWLSARVRKKSGCKFLFYLSLFSPGLIWVINKEGTVWWGLAEWHCRGLAEWHCRGLAEWLCRGFVRVVLRVFVRVYMGLFGSKWVSARKLTLTFVMFGLTAISDLICALFLLWVLFVYTPPCLWFSNVICSFERLQEIKEKGEARYFCVVR